MKQKLQEALNKIREAQCEIEDDVALYARMDDLMNNVQEIMDGLE